MKTDQEKLAESGGVPAREMTKFLDSIEFELPDSGEKVVMLKPRVKHILATSDDKTVSADSNAEMFLATVSQICTFDGKPRNWHDMGEMPAADYMCLNDKYLELTEPGKKKEAAK